MWPGSRWVFAHPRGPPCYFRSLLSSTFSPNPASFGIGNWPSSQRITVRVVTSATRASSAWVIPARSRSRRSSDPLIATNQ